jgi:hypothetical protein
MKKKERKKKKEENERKGLTLTGLLMEGLSAIIEGAITSYQLAAAYRLNFLRRRLRLHTCSVNCRSPSATTCCGSAGESPSAVSLGVDCPDLDLKHLRRVRQQIRHPFFFCIGIPIMVGNGRLFEPIDPSQEIAGIIG